MESQQYNFECKTCGHRKSWSSIFYEMDEATNNRLMTYVEHLYSPNVYKFIWDKDEFNRKEVVRLYQSEREHNLIYYVDENHQLLCKYNPTQTTLNNVNNWSEWESLLSSTINEETTDIWGFSDEESNSWYSPNGATSPVLFGATSRNDKKVEERTNLDWLSEENPCVEGEVQEDGLDDHKDFEQERLDSKEMSDLIQNIMRAIEEKNLSLYDNNNSSDSEEWSSSSSHHEIEEESHSQQESNGDNVNDEVKIKLDVDVQPLSEKPEPEQVTPPVSSGGFWSYLGY